MKPEIKKQIILHLPYLMFVYLFDKVAQAFRLAQGADLSAKLMNIGQGFSAAFANAAPSFNPMDLLIGVAGAVIIRLVIYSKQKNAKKYRKGMEYGTARWGIHQNDVHLFSLFRHIYDKPSGVIAVELDILYIIHFCILYCVTDCIRVQFHPNHLSGLPACNQANGTDTAICI